MSTRYKVRRVFHDEYALETDIPADQLVVPYRVIRFDSDGQNKLARGIMLRGV